MQDKHAPGKETDITAALVIVFALLVAVTIAKVAGDFTKQTTSTSSRASYNYSSASDCANKYKNGISSDKYTVVGAVSSCGKDSSNMDKVTVGLIGVGYKCCVTVATYRTYSNNKCSSLDFYYTDGTKGTKVMQCKPIKQVCKATNYDINNEYDTRSYTRIQNDPAKDDVLSICTTIEEGSSKYATGSCCSKD